MTKVLLVDREDGSLRETRDALEQAGLEPTFVTSGRAALKLVETRLYVVVGAEFSLADMAGPEFLSRASAAAPGTGLLLIAGMDDLQEPAASTRGTDPFPASRPPRAEGERRTLTGKVPGTRVLLKPYDPDQLVTNLVHLARMAEMRRSTHAMTSAVARDDDAPSERPPRSIIPPRKE